MFIMNTISINFNSNWQTGHYAMLDIENKKYNPEIMQAIWLYINVTVHILYQVNFDLINLVWLSISFDC